MPEGISFIFINPMTQLRSTFQDPELGPVYILSRSNARHITMRIKADGIYVTASPSASLTHIKNVLEEFRTRIANKQKEMPPRPVYDFNFRLETDCLQLTFQPTDGKRFYLTSTPGKETIYCPSTTDFHQDTIQEWLHKVVCEALRKQAKSYLPQRLRYQSERCGLPFNKVSIRGSQSRWGSCSSKKDINLSYFLMKLPSRLIDVVLIHELCHTVEMNHGPRFYALMDKYTDGQSKALTAELKQYKADI